jgi:hypothetical protein
MKSKLFLALLFVTIPSLALASTSAEATTIARYRAAVRSLRQEIEKRADPKCSDDAPTPAWSTSSIPVGIASSTLASYSSIDSLIFVLLTASSDRQFPAWLLAFQDAGGTMADLQDSYARVGELAAAVGQSGSPLDGARFLFWLKKVGYPWPKLKVIYGSVKGFLDSLGSDFSGSDLAEAQCLVRDLRSLGAGPANLTSGYPSARSSNAKLPAVLKDLAKLADPKGASQLLESLKKAGGNIGNLLGGFAGLGDLLSTFNSYGCGSCHGGGATGASPVGSTLGGLAGDIDQLKGQGQTAKQIVGPVGLGQVLKNPAIEAALKPAAEVAAPVPAPSPAVASEQPTGVSAVVIQEVIESAKASAASTASAAKGAADEWLVKISKTISLTAGSLSEAATEQKAAAEQAAKDKAATAKAEQDKLAAQRKTNEFIVSEAKTIITYVDGAARRQIKPEELQKLARTYKDKLVFLAKLVPESKIEPPVVQELVVIKPSDPTKDQLGRTIVPAETGLPASLEPISRPAETPKAGLFYEILNQKPEVPTGERRVEWTYVVP